MNWLQYSNRMYLFLLIFIFHLGWLKFYVEGQELYVIDYGLRVLVILLFLKTMRWHIVLQGSISFKMVLYGFVAFTACVLFSDYVDTLSWERSFDTYFFQTVSFPVIADKALLLFDLSIGLLLVGLSEEAVYRVLFVKEAEERGWGNVQLYVYSIFWFAILHLPQGLTNVVIAAVFGYFLMWFYLRTRSFLFVSVAHLLVNMWFFGSDYAEFF